MALQFKAIVLCGYGQKLYPLTESTPKPLLTVANKPLISYVVDWCHQSGLSDILVLSPSSFSNQLNPLLRSHGIAYETVDDDKSANWESGDWLRHFSSLITTDFILLPCDIIPPSTLPLSAIVQHHTTSHYNTLITSLCYYNSFDFGTREGPSPCTSIYDKTSLSMITPPTDSFDGMELRSRMLWEFPNLTLSSKLLDAHVYVLRRGVLDLLLERPQIASIREDLLPWLSKWSYQSGLSKKWNHALNIPEDPFSDAIKYSTMQTYASEASTHIPPQQRPRVQCYIHDPKDGVIGRANTLGGYAELNREQLRQHRPQPNVKTVAPGSLTSENVKVGEKSLIKMSIIGRNVDIGKGCKIIGSIIADNVVIKDGAKLDNCIVCTRAKIGERATLTLCDVGGDSDVISDTHAKNEKISLDG